MKARRAAGVNDPIMLGGQSNVAECPLESVLQAAAAGVISLWGSINEYSLVTPGVPSKLLSQHPFTECCCHGLRVPDV